MIVSAYTSTVGLVHCPWIGSVAMTDVSCSSTVSREMLSKHFFKVKNKITLQTSVLHLSTTHIQKSQMQFNCNSQTLFSCCEFDLYVH